MDEKEKFDSNSKSLKHLLQEVHIETPGGSVRNRHNTIGHVFDGNTLHRIPSADILNPQHKYHAHPSGNQSEETNFTTQVNNNVDEHMDCEDKGWTIKSNLLLLIWLSRSLSLLRSHYNKMRRAKFAYNCLTIFYVMISTLSSSLSFFNVGTGEESDTVTIDTSKPIGIAIAVMSILTAVVAGVLAFLKLGDIIANERYAITKFSKMVREIEMVIYSDIEDRPEAKEFLNLINERYYKYHNSSEVLEETIEDWKYRIEEAAKMNNSCFPDQQVHIATKDITKDGRIQLSENVIQVLQRAHSFRRKSSKSSEDSKNSRSNSTGKSSPEESSSNSTFRKDSSSDGSDLLQDDRN